MVTEGPKLIHKTESSFSPNFLFAAEGMETRQREELGHGHIVSEREMEETVICGPPTMCSINSLHEDGPFFHPSQHECQEHLLQAGHLTSIISFNPTTILRGIIISISQTGKLSSRDMTRSDTAI